MTTKIKRLLPFRCYSEECYALGRFSAVYHVDDILAPCPICGRRTLQPLDVIHLIVESSLRGDLRGSAFANKQDKLYDFMCERSSRGYREHPNHPHHPRLFTTVPSAATCYECLLAYGDIKPCS